MRRTHQTLALGIATALVAASFGIAALAFAQSPAQAKPQRPNLDGNSDGVIDRSEAAAMPRLAEKFDQLDRNNDGRLDRSEQPRRHGKGRRGGHGGKHGVVAMDTDKDGRISRAEAAASPRGKDALADNFAAIDANRDGYLMGSEMRAHHERMRAQRQAGHAERFDAKFAEADLNRDGRLSRVEVAEKMPRVAERFAWLDEDRDGFIGREELRAAKPRR